jgi:hypothetical protein
LNTTGKRVPRVLRTPRVGLGRCPRSSGDRRVAGLPVIHAQPCRGAGFPRHTASASEHRDGESVDARQSAAWMVVARHFSAGCSWPRVLMDGRERIRVSRPDIRFERADRLALRVAGCAMRLDLALRGRPRPDQLDRTGGCPDDAIVPADLWIGPALCGLITSNNTFRSGFLLRS